jgi:hypothetical protein
VDDFKKLQEFIREASEGGSTGSGTPPEGGSTETSARPQRDFTENRTSGFANNRVFPREYFWGLIAFGVFVVISVVTSNFLSRPTAVVSAPAAQAKTDRDQQVESLNQQFRDLRTELKATNEALTTLIQRQQSVEMYNAARLKDFSQTLTRLEATQGQDMSLLRARVVTVETKVTSVEKGNKNLSQDFARSLLLNGATRTRSAFASDGTNFPLELESAQIPNRTGVTKREVQCALTFKGQGFFCDVNGSASRE